MGATRMDNPIAYSHLPIRSIRLLEIHEDRAGDYVGSLKIASLDDVPPYYALSYCWGREPESIPLKLTDGTLSISPNLDAAVQRLRTMSSDDSENEYYVRYIWIDRICINQNDISERSAQVGLMGHIYSKSIRTLIWLGSDIATCPGAWSLVAMIYDVCTRQNPSLESIVDIPFKLYSDTSHAASGLPTIHHKHWRSLSILLEDPWFTRIWIIQEIALSTKDPIILHGEHSFPWLYLGWAASWMRRNGYLRLSQFPEALRNVDEISNIRRSRERWPLNALLAATSSKFYATDQRDKVYALLSIAFEANDNESRPSPLQPDYSLHVEEVYLRTARYLLETSRSLSMIIRTRIWSETSTGPQHTHDLARLPTWVPDWSDFNVCDRDITKSFSWIKYSGRSDPVSLEFPKHCAASAGRPLSLSGSNSDALQINGTRVDTIVYSFPFSNPSRCNNDFINSFTTESLRIMRNLTPHVSKMGFITWITDYIKTTTAEQYELSGRSCEMMLKDGAAYILELLLANDKLCRDLTCPSGDLHALRQLESFAAGGKAVNYAALARNFCYGRSLVITEKRRMGLALASTKIGDVVSILYGGGVPYILRGHEDVWQFMGDSYFPDLSQGEGLHTQEPETPGGETFSII